MNKALFIYPAEAVFGTTEEHRHTANDLRRAIGPGVLGSLGATNLATGPGCIRCKMTKGVMVRKGVEFVEVDIRQNAAAREYVTEELEHPDAPVCVVEDGTGEDYWSGFRPDNISRLAALANGGE